MAQSALTKIGLSGLGQVVEAFLANLASQVPKGGPSAVWLLYKVVFSIHVAEALTTFAIVLRRGASLPVIVRSN